MRVGTDTGQPLPVSVPGSEVVTVNGRRRGGEGRRLSSGSTLGSTTAAAVGRGCRGALGSVPDAVGVDRPTYRRLPTPRGAAAMAFVVIMTPAATHRWAGAP